MENPKTQIVEQVKAANNVLVTVSANPSVDQLAAAIGLTLLLNKLGKHATAVYSGNTPSTIEFLQPESTLEKNTDSLRDFIIALDKSKADKLRYKVEDKMVRIFITPYRTSISDKDLEFSQGDFNVDVVVGLGVKVREDLDQAITAHGRILHDATIMTINTQEAGNLGTLNWVDNKASSLCEMVVGMVEMLKSGSLDEQMATALLTGIVAETDRFSNSKTTSETMAASAKLMTAGANQQLVATKLQEPEKPQDDSHDEPNGDGSIPPDDNGGGHDNSDGSLSIDHEELPEPQSEEVQIDEHGNFGDDNGEDEEAKLETDNRHMLVEPPTENDDEDKLEPTHRVVEPPVTGGQLTANTEPEGLDPSTDPLTQSTPVDHAPLLSHVDQQQPTEPEQQEPQPEPELPELTPLEPTPSEPPESTPPEPAAVEEVPVEPTPQPGTIPSVDEILQPATPDTPVEDDNTQTIAEIEEAVDSPHVDETDDAPISEVPPEHLDAARDAVQAAVVNNPEPPLEPISALNAQPVDLNLSHEETPLAEQPSVPQPLEDTPVENQNIHIDADGMIQLPGELTVSQPPNQPLTPLGDTGLPTNLVPPMPGLPPDPTASPSVTDPTAPPPVPPPMMPPAA